MKLIPLEDILNTFSAEDRTEIEINAQKMILECQLQQLQDELTKLGQEHSQHLGIQNPIPAPLDNNSLIGISALKNYVETMGGKLSLHIDFPTGKHLGFNI